MANANLLYVKNAENMAIQHKAMKLWKNINFIISYSLVLL